MINPMTFDPCPARGKLERVLARPPLFYQAKLDGTRAVLSQIDNQTYLTGRRTSVVTGTKLDKISHMPLLQNYLADGTVLDGEITHPCGFGICAGIMNSKSEQAALSQAEHGTLIYNAFDMLFDGGTDIRHLPYAQRWERLANSIYQRVDHDTPITLVQNFEGNFEEALLQAYASGYEGLVVKTQDGPYHHLEWAKVKAKNTYDMVIVGYEDSEAETFKDNGIAALRLGLYNGEAFVEVTSCSGLTHAQRREFFTNPDKYLLSVVEVAAQEMFPTGALRHPRFIRIRDDVDAESQTFDKYGIKHE